MNSVSSEKSSQSVSHWSRPSEVSSVICCCCVARVLNTDRIECQNVIHNHSFRRIMIDASTTRNASASAIRSLRSRENCSHCTASTSYPRIAIAAAIRSARNSVRPIQTIGKEKSTFIPFRPAALLIFITVIIRNVSAVRRLV